jgi:GGDEF domain-containing protein
MLANSTPIPALPELSVTFSAGLTAYHDSEALHACIERADRALYEAKDTGRNRTVIVHGPAYPDEVATQATAVVAN